MNNAFLAFVMLLMCTIVISDRAGDAEIDAACSATCEKQNPCGGAFDGVSGDKKIRCCCATQVGGCKVAAEVFGTNCGEFIG